MTSIPLEVGGFRGPCPFTKCLACGKPLKLIGVERVNGRRNYKDWETREYHKQCYLKIKKEENSFNYIYNRCPKQI